MRIANPIYDVTFKYLFDDEKVARLMLSALLGKPVLELQIRPAELHHAAPKPDGSQLLVLRLDFLGTLLEPDGGRKQVLIELRKAHDAMDVRRFWRFLAGKPAVMDTGRLDPGGREQALPVVAIYFLAEGMAGVAVPVLKYQPISGLPEGDTGENAGSFLDLATGDEFESTDPFVEGLPQEGIVVQIDQLKNRGRTELERLLEVFDQAMTARMDPHLLDIPKEPFPEHHREVLHRLMRAGAEQKVLDQMDMEDEILAAFQDHARECSDLRQALAEQDQALAEQTWAIEELDRRIADRTSRLSST